MTLFVRGITVLTVLLGLATMAVSAYAAKADVEGSYSAADVASAAESVEGEADEPDRESAEATSPTSPTPPPTPPTPAMPTTMPHYAVPFDAPSLVILSPRRDAAPRVQVWPVLSLKPLPAQDSSTGIASDQLAVMQRVSQETGIPWQIFAAIARVESDFGRNMSTSWAGAIGYGQFLPVTWADYGNGGDPYDFRDVIPAMGRYLLVARALDDLPRAIYAYNHSWSYVSQVLSYAAAYGFQATN